MSSSRTGGPRGLAQRVVVLGGGGSRRLGQDKLAAQLGASTVLDTLLAGLVGVLADAQITVVGPARPTCVPVRWCQESPPGGGPVAGLAAALPDDPDAVVGVVAGDQPFAAAALPVLLGARGQADAAIGVDSSGRDQPLLGAYRTGPLRAAIGAQASGRAVHSVLSQLTVVRVSLDAAWCLDVDTAADLATARAMAKPRTPTLER